jgi:hypothetical protein
MIINVNSSSCKVPLFLSDFNQTWIFSTRFLKNNQIQKIAWNTFQWQLRCSIWTNGRTYRHDEVNNNFFAILRTCPTKITSYIYITSKFSGSWICLTRFCNGSWGEFFWICCRLCTPTRASVGCTPSYFVTLPSTGRRARRPGLLSTAQDRTQYLLANFRCDDVTSSSGNCKADGFYADSQH